MSELFVEDGNNGATQVTARRSIGEIGRAVRVTTANYDYSVCAPNFGGSE